MSDLAKNLVLVVDDEFLIAQGLCLQVEDMDLAVCATAATADDAVALAQAHRPELVLMDMRLRGAVRSRLRGLARGRPGPAARRGGPRPDRPR